MVNEAEHAGEAVAHGTEHAAHGTGNVLTKRLGPLPAWGWLIAGGGALVVMLYARAHVSAASPGTQDATASDTGGGGGAVGGGSTTQTEPGSALVSPPGADLPGIDMGVGPGAGPTPGNSAPAQQIEAPNLAGAGRTITNIATDPSGKSATDIIQFGPNPNPVTTEPPAPSGPTQPAQSANGPNTDASGNLVAPGGVAPTWAPTPGF